MSPTLLSKMKPAGYTIAALLLSAGGFCNGYDTGSIGAVTVMPQWIEVMGAQSPTIIGLTISMVMFGGAISSPFAGQLATKYSHPRVIAAGGVAFAIGGILQASAMSLGQFIAGRLIAGLAEGIFLGLLSVYVCEISPSKIRGTLASVIQLAIALGLVCGYFTCYGSVRLESSMAWRVPFIIATLVSSILVGGCFYIPLSPRWLIAARRRDEAAKAIERLGIHPAEAEKDILSFREEDIQKELGMMRSIGILFSTPYRARTMLALFILGMVQLCGIDGVLFYAPTLFAQAGLSKQSAAFLASGLSAILIFAISIPAMFLADRIGRRASVIVGGILLTASMLLVGAMYAADLVHPDSGARWVVIVSIFVFALTYAATWAMVGKIYASEIQPGHTRAASSSIAGGLNFLSNAIIALITPILLDHSAYGAYFLFGGLSLFTTVVLAVYMPETKGQPLEAIQEAFSGPLRIHGTKLFHYMGSRRAPRGEHQPIEMSMLG